MMHKELRRLRSRSKDYDVGYARPPVAGQFQKGASGNPTGKRRRPKAPDLKTQLQAALNKPVSVRIGNRQKTVSQGAAGIEQLVYQFAKGDRNARRDLIVLCEKLGVDLIEREALQGALDDALSAEDEALLADFVARHGGRYPDRADALPNVVSQDQKLVAPPTDDSKLIAARPDVSASPQMVQPQENSNE
jgi:hypothetical protein